MLKAFSAIALGCILASGVSLGAAQAEDETVELVSAPTIVRCPGWAADKGHCSEGERAWRFVFSVPQCWTVKVQGGTRRSGPSWSAYRDSDCEDTGAKPRVMRFFADA